MSTPQNPGGAWPPPQQPDPSTGHTGPPPYGPPAIPNPYGPPPQDYGQGQQGWPAEHAQQPPGPPQYPGPWGPPPVQRPRQRDAEPGRFTWWDLGATLFYVLGFMTGLVGLIGLLPPVDSMLTSEDPDEVQRGLFAINAVSYVVLSAVAVALCGAALWRSIVRLKYLWWLKLLLVPVAWVVTLILNLLLVVLIFGAEPETSENQVAIEAMLGAVPFLAAVVVIGLLGPFVEEYFFRHLLIGKLSRYLNVWICGAISVIAFPLLHFIPALIGLADDLTLVAVVPYLTMGLLITVGYIITGRNLFYAWVLHAFNNVMSLLLAYFVQPWAEQYLEEFENAAAALGVLARLIT